MKEYVFGVDIGGTSVKLGLFNTNGELLEKWEIPTVKEDNGSHILPDVAASIQKKMQEKSLTFAEVEGIGVGVPGAVTKDGQLLDGSANIGWGAVNLADTLAELTGLPVRAVNDANAAAMGEAWQGSGKGCENMVLVTLGTGVGGGIVSDGKIVTGFSGAGGEIGHICVNYEETELCGCKGTGCLEQYASATGIVRLAKKRLEKDDAPSILRNEELSAKAVFDAVKAGDAVAIEIAEQFGDYLAKGLALVSKVVNPEIYVIGGGVSKAGDILLQYIEKPFLKYATFTPAKLAIASLGNDAGIFGAAGVILR